MGLERASRTTLWMEQQVQRAPRAWSLEQEGATLLAGLVLLFGGSRINAVLLCIIASFLGWFKMGQG